MHKCRITVLKRTVNQDLADQYLDRSGEFGGTFGACTAFQEGQEFVVESPFSLPPGFPCSWAWADLRPDIFAIALGASMPWLKQPGTAIAGCTDILRPVIFKVERVE